jgi:hypothetical protein
MLAQRPIASAYLRLDPAGVCLRFPQYTGHAIMPIESKHSIEPAYRTISMLGGKTAVARELGLSPSTVSRWCTPQPAGTGGNIPTRYWRQLLAMAKQQKIELAYTDLSNL